MKACHHGIKDGERAFIDITRPGIMMCHKCWAGLPDLKPKTMTAAAMLEQDAKEREEKMRRIRHHIRSLAQIFDVHPYENE
jgi:hypothetical protein